jgi:hypothetical protein
MTRDQKAFIEYFTEFYGPKGFYPIEGWTPEQVLLGISLRGRNFEGDSIDREAIRDIILVAQNKMGGAFAQPY